MIRKVLILPALLLSLAACSSDPGEPVVPASVTANSAAVQTGTVALPVAVSPSVLVLSASEAPVRGVTVTWSVLEGNGELSQTTSVTNSSGVAALGSWTLGNLVGLNRIAASVAALPAVEFQATASAGSSVAVQALAGDNQSVFTGQIVPVDPSVRVVDQFGNGVPSVQVTFAVTAGGGAVEGAVQITDQNGVATIAAWRVGVLAGANTLSASIPGRAPVQFVANASVSARCAVITPYVLQSVVNGSLSFDDCLLPDAFYYDFFQTTFASTQVVRFDMQSAAFDPFLILASSDGNLLAANYDPTSQTMNARLTLVAAPGDVRVVLSSAFEFEEGPYVLTSTVLPNLNAGCGENVFVMRGITLPQSLAGGDCVVPGGPFLADEFVIRLVGGVPVTITMTSTALDAYLEVFSEESAVPVAENDDISGTDFNARIIYTPPVSGYYIISASSHFPDEVGAYVLTIAPGVGGSIVTPQLMTGSPIDALLRDRGVLPRKRNPLTRQGSTR